MSLRAVIVALVFAACGPDRFAGLEMGPRRTKLHERILANELANGLRVVLLPDARTNLVAVGVHYEVGSSDDPAGDSGLAHYAEHLLAGVAYRGDGTALLDAALDENAMTSVDRTYFFATALDVDLDRVLEVAARRLEAKCEDFDDQVLARERDVVIEEAKERSRFRWGGEALAAAIWGADHPYARDTGGTGFVDVARDQLCDFIARRYGPRSAVLVVTGNVRDEHWVKIRERFEKIAGPPQATRAAIPSPTTTTARVTVRGLERPTVMLTFPVPAAGSETDAVLSAVKGARWMRGDGGTAYATVFGERRARVLAICGDTEDVSSLGDVENTLREMVRLVGIPDFAGLKDRARIAAMTRLDEILGAGFELAGTAARREPMTRFGTLNALDKLSPRDVMKLLDLSKARVVVLLPEVGANGKHRVSDTATELHQLDVTRAAPTELPKVSPPTVQVVEFRLANGLRVLLSPDAASLGFEARFVIDTGASDLARSAAWLLEPDDGRGDPSVAKRVAWYRSIGATAIPHIGDAATTFNISGLSTFADWHVWHLAWTVLHGSYPRWIDRPRRRDTEAPRPPREPPAALTVLLPRLAGELAVRPTRASRAELERFRRSAYRPESSTLIVVGNFDPSAMRKEIEPLFGRWRGGPRVTFETSSRSPRIRSFVAIPAKDATSVDVAVAFAPTGKAVRSERVARAVLDEILRDRLRVIREGLGISYGIQAQVDDDSVIIAGSVEPAFAADAARAIMAEVARVREGGPEIDADFARARRRVLVRALARPLGPSVRADALERIAIERRSVSDLGLELEEIQKLDPATFRRLAARELRTDLMLASVRGDGDLELVLRALGATTIEHWKP